MYPLYFLISFFLPSKQTFYSPIEHKITVGDTCKVPTVITPNGDGENDFLEILCLPKDDKLNKSELYVFSEWGEQVGYFRPYRNEWNGTYRDKPLPDGTYFYVFKLTPDTLAQRGYITLFR